MDTTTGPIDCACVIHGQAYSWNYVERLYNMLSRNLSRGIRFHVYTESSRPVPAHMIKHNLDDWGIRGPQRSWWYKMQLFNPEHHSGPLLYFDLDTVIVNNLDWIVNLPLNYFWSIRDFKYLWRPNHFGINSSIMWWNTQTYSYVYNEFHQQGMHQIMHKFRGDQDFITHIIPDSQRRFLDPERVKSWRWQCHDGGYDFHTKRHFKPNTGALLRPETCVLVFHGQPKPDQVQDSLIISHWQ